MLVVTIQKSFYWSCVWSDAITIGVGPPYSYTYDHHCLVVASKLFSFRNTLSTTRVQFHVFQSPLLHTYTNRSTNTLPKQTCPLALSPPSSTLHPVICVPVGGEVVMVEMLTGRKMRKLGGHYGTVHCLSVHPHEQVSCEMVNPFIDL